MTKRSAVLTDKLVHSLVKEDKAYLYWDDRGLRSGLAVCVYPSGAKTWFSYYSYGKGRMGSHKLGDVSTLSVVAARKKSIAAREKVDQGLDPKSDDPRRADSWEQLIDAWYEAKQESRVTGSATLSFVKHHTRPWFKRPCVAIRDREITTLLGKVKTSTAKGQSAVRLHLHLVTIFKWAVKTKRIKDNPMHAVDAPGEINKRDLPWFRGEKSDGAIRKLWEAAGQLDRDDQLFVKLLLLVPKRRNAIQHMSWEQISQDWHWVPIKGSRTKKNLDVTLPLLARRLLGQRGDGGPCLVMSESRLCTLLPELRKLTKIDDFIFHGVRHMCATWLAGRRDVPPHIARLVLDHPASDDVHEEHYVHGAYRPLVAEALEAWAQHVEALVAPAAGVAVLR